MRKFLLTKPRADVMALMADGQARTVRQISYVLRGCYNSGLGTAVRLLVDDGQLVLVESISRAPVYCLPKVEAVIDRSGTNPFEWRTYKQYEAEVS